MFSAPRRAAGARQRGAVSRGPYGERAHDGHGPPGARAPAGGGPQLDRVPGLLLALPGGHGRPASGKGLARVRTKVEERISAVVLLFYCVEASCCGLLLRT